jgi:hypothetical protein
MMSKELIDELLTEAGIQRSKFAPDCAGLLEAAAAALAQPAAPAPDAATADQIMALADAYARVYSFVHDNTMALARATLRAAVERVVAELEAYVKEDAIKASVNKMLLERAERAEAERDALLTQIAAQAVPEGWKLAPVEPTEAMLVAARDWSAKKYGRPVGNDGAGGCWAAMLAAAPEVKE